MQSALASGDGSLRPSRPSETRQAIASSSANDERGSSAAQVEPSQLRGSRMRSGGHRLFRETLIKCPVQTVNHRGHRGARRNNRGDLCLCTIWRHRTREPAELTARHGRVKDPSLHKHSAHTSAPHSISLFLRFASPLLLQCLASWKITNFWSHKTVSVKWC